jgi:hypothetical protein
MYDNWLKAVEGSPEWMTMPLQQKQRLAAQKQQEFLRQTMRDFKIAGPLQGSDSLTGKTNNAALTEVSDFMDR